MAQNDLKILLSSMDAELNSEIYVFCTVSEALYQRLTIKPLGMFREKEGVTLIITQQEAIDAKLEHSDLWSLITCNINSALTAVGFLAAMSAVLADSGIAVNAISAFYHDHLFVPADRAEQAVHLLKQLAETSAG